MDEINDELLNKFLDKELDPADILRVEKEISNSEDLRKRYQALKTVHHGLMKMEAEETSHEFLNKVMTKLNRRGYYFKQQNYFLAAIYLVFMGGAIALVGYIMYGMFSVNTETAYASDIIDSTLVQFSNFTSSIKNYFNDTNISLIGSILAFTLIISGYLLFESFKNSKTNLNKI
jgi:hypothetical protein